MHESTSTIRIHIPDSKIWPLTIATFSCPEEYPDGDYNLHHYAQEIKSIDECKYVDMRSFNQGTLLRIRAAPKAIPRKFLDRLLFKRGLEMYLTPFEQYLIIGLKEFTPKLKWHIL